MYRLWEALLAPFLLFCFETRSYYVALGGFQIPCVNKEFLTVLKKESTCLCLPGTGMAGFRKVIFIY